MLGEATSLRCCGHIVTLEGQSHVCPSALSGDTVIGSIMQDAHPIIAQGTRYQLAFFKDNSPYIMSMDNGSDDVTCREAWHQTRASPQMK